LLHFTTEAFAPAEKVAAWREIYGRQFVSTDFEPEARDSFNAEVTICAYQGLDIGSTRLGLTRFSRTRGLINSDHLVLVTLESGRWWGAHLGREVDLAPGDATLCWTAEHIDGRVEGDATIIHIPTAAIAPMVGDIGSRVSPPLEGLFHPRHHCGKRAPGAGSGGARARLGADPHAE